LQFQLQAQVFQVEFVRAFPLPQTFPVQIIRPLTLVLNPLPLFFSFQNQRTDHRFQRFAVLRKVVQLRTHNVRLL